MYVGFYQNEGISSLKGDSPLVCHKPVKVWFEPVCTITKQGINKCLGICPPAILPIEGTKRVFLDALWSNAPQAWHLKSVQDLVIYLVKCKIFKSVSFNLKWT
jgi:hypothetical protein